MPDDGGADAFCHQVWRAPSRARARARRPSSHARARARALRDPNLRAGVPQPSGGRARRVQAHGVQRPDTGERRDRAGRVVRQGTLPLRGREQGRLLSGRAVYRLRHQHAPGASPQKLLPSEYVSECNFKREIPIKRGRGGGWCRVAQCPLSSARWAARIRRGGARRRPTGHTAARHSGRPPHPPEPPRDRRRRTAAGARGSPHARAPALGVEGAVLVDALVRVEAVALRLDERGARQARVAQGVVVREARLYSRERERARRGGGLSPPGRWSSAARARRARAHRHAGRARLGERGAPRGLAPASASAIAGASSRLGSGRRRGTPWTSASSAARMMQPPDHARAAREVDRPASAAAAAAMRLRPCAYAHSLPQYSACPSCATSRPSRR